MCSLCSFKLLHIHVFEVKHFCIFRTENNHFVFLFIIASLSFTLSGEEEAPEHTAIIAGVVAALVLLVFLTLLAVYYINTHPTVAPPIYLMQVSTNPSIHPSLLLYSLDQLII